MFMYGGLLMFDLVTQVGEWCSPLYAVNVFYYHWLTKKLLWPMVEQNIGRWENYTECRDKEGYIGTKGQR